MRNFLFSILFVLALFSGAKSEIPQFVNGIEITISPNPANDFFDLKVDDQQISFKDVEITIFDIIGTRLTNYTVIHKSSTDNVIMRVNIDSFKSGMYIVKVKAPNLLKTERLIVDKNN